MQWQKYLSRAHLNSLNCALYSSDSGAEIRVENVGNDNVLGIKTFLDVGAAEDWYDNLPGSGLGRLDNAIDIIIN